MTVTEIPLRLEPVTEDPFIAGLEITAPPPVDSQRRPQPQPTAAG